MKKLLLVFLILFIVFIAIIYSYFLFIQEDKVVVLTFHDVVDKISDDPKTTVNITTKKFEKYIKWLHKNHFHAITMDELYDWKMNNKSIPRRSVLLTFDDGWKSYYTKALPLLEKYNMNSSVFVKFKYSEYCTENDNDTYMNYSDIQDVVDNHKYGQILSHSYDLHEKYFGDSNNYELYDKDIKIVEKYGYDIKYYAYPYGHRTENYIKALKDNNYRLAFTFGPYDYVRKDDNNFEIPRMGIFESTQTWKFKIKMILEL